MRRTLVDRLREDAVLAQDLLDASGRVLLRRGQKLAASSLERLGRLGVSEILIDDERLADLDIRPMLPPATQSKLVHTAASVYGRVAGRDDDARGSVIWHGDLAETVRLLVDDLVQGGPARFEPLAVVGLDYVIAHAVNAAVLSVLTARRCGVARQDQLQALAAGALLADLGMMRLPHGVRFKAGPLDEAEWALVRKHPETGLRALGESIPAHSKVVVLSHHERRDGSGYPRGLQGDEIHPLARIASAADVYLALTEDRPQRRRMAPHEALEFMMSEAGRLFPVDVVDAVSRVVNPYPLGVKVRLTSGEAAAVVGLGAVAGRPVVRLLEGADGRPVQPRDLDLSQPELQTVFIQELLYD